MLLCALWMSGLGACSNDDGGPGWSEAASAGASGNHTIIESCSSDRHCPDPSRGHCDVESGDCRECLRDEHCTRSWMPLCDAERGRCAECVESRCDGICGPVGGCVECVEDTDCEPNQACALDDSCRDRCVNDSDCASGNCYLDSCGDAIGDACDPDESLTACLGRDCIDVDVHGATVEPYCTALCGFGIGECPDGFLCLSSKCRRM